jgi:hypothetical protein
MNTAFDHVRQQLEARLDHPGRLEVAAIKFALARLDNGSDMYVTGAMDARWNNDQLNPAFASFSAADFDVIQLGWR